MSQPPSQVSLAVKLMYAGAVLALLNAVLLPLQSDQIRESVAENTVSGSGVDVDTVVTTTIVAGVIFGLIYVGVWIWMAVMNGKGKNWARITSTVLGGLNIAIVPLSLVAGAAMGQAGTPISIVLGLVGLVLAATILFLIWQPASSAYYAANRPAPAPGYPPVA